MVALVTTPVRVSKELSSSAANVSLGSPSRGPDVASVSLDTSHDFLNRSVFRFSEDISVMFRSAFYLLGCAADHFKDLIGPSDCVPCPQQSHSIGGAKECDCPDGQTWDWQSKKCSGYTDFVTPLARSMNVFGHRTSRKHSSVVEFYEIVASFHKFECI